MRRTLQKRISFGRNLGLGEADALTLARLTSPEDIQDFISGLGMNHEKDGDSCMSAALTLEKGFGHCIESAFVAATALWMGGSPPLLMDMQACDDDADHVIALFRSHGCWGAISKSNHVWLRWRDPVYRTLRELAMSYFHEYTLKEQKTLRTYSVSFDLRRFSPDKWVTHTEPCWEVATALDDCRHYKLLTPAQVRALKPRDRLELKADRLLEYAH